MKAFIAPWLAVLMAGTPVFPQAPALPSTLHMTSSGKTHFLEPATFQELLKTLPVPPEPGSLGAQADLEAVLQVQVWRSPEQEAFARRIDQVSLFDASEVLGPWFTADHLPQLAKFLRQVIGDSGVAGGQAKKQFARLRPPYVDARVHPCIEVPPRSSYSYPSGHSTLLNLEALVLAEIFPEQRERLLAWGRQAAWARILAGVHFPTDDVGGRILAEALFSAMRKNPRFLSDLENCRKEAAPFLLEKAG
jgi:acid phosphatase (class A)